MSGGFFRGTTADQDTRFSNKHAKLLKSQKFPPELENLVDTTKVKMDVMRPWIAHRVTELLGFEDEVLINFIYGLLEEKVVNGKEIQISLTGFMEKNTGKFMKELWTHLLSAQQNASGVPQQFLDAKEEETRKKQEDTDRITRELKKTKEKEGREYEQERAKMDREADNVKAAALEPHSRRPTKFSSKWSADDKGADERNGAQELARINQSPHSADHSLSPPRRARSRSFSKSLSNSRSPSRSRSLSASTKPIRRSVSSERRHRSLSRRSSTPRRVESRMRSPPKRYASSSLIRSPSPVRRRLRSPRRHRSRSPVLNRSRSPVRRRSRSPLRRRSRSPIRRRSRSPIRRRSRSPIRQRSRTPIRRRSRTPIRRRLRSPIRRRSRSPISRRSRTPIRRRSRSPIRRRSRSPIRRRSPSPFQRRPRSHRPRSRSSESAPRNMSLSPRHSRSPPVRGRSPSPVRQRYQRALSSPHHRSPSPVKRRTTFPGRQRSPTPGSRSSSPSGRVSLSPKQATPPSMLKRGSPKRQQRSPVQSSRDGHRSVQRSVPDRQAPRKETAERPTVSVRSLETKTRLRAIENSLENGQLWVPPSPGHRKTWEEEAHIERALHDHFLFRKLTDSQCHVLLDCMQRVEVQAGDTVVKQGGEGDCFYVVGSGEFEVFATQEETNGAVARILQRYTADKLSSFGELALMYNKPLQASVRAVTNGTLWALKREDFRGILTSEFSNLSSLKLLRSVDLLSRLTILQLSLIADALSEVSFSSGQTIVNEGDGLSGLYLIQKGQVRITFDSYISSQNASSLMSDVQKVDDDDMLSGSQLSMEKSEGSYFGEWTLLGECINSLHVVALENVVCAVLTKERFESVVGPLPKILQDDCRSRETSSDLPREPVRSIDTSSLSKVQLSDLEWKTCLYSTDCCEIGLVQPKDSEHLFSLKRFSKQKIKKLGKEEQVLKEKKLIKHMHTSPGVPQVLCTCADQNHVGILLNTLISCPVTSILHSPLDEPSARFCAASVVVALDELHKAGVLYRGVSPEVLIFSQTGHVQLVDFRFGKKLSSERTFTICGMVDSLAPEIVQGKGHGFAADWWALGVLIYFMLQSEMPFGSWRENELDTFAKIAKGQFTLPETFSPEVVDLITKLLQVDENGRLGSKGDDSVKSHKWFDGVDWESVKDASCSVPQEILTRIDQYLETRPSETSEPVVLASEDMDDLNTPEWLNDW